jgi:hypothetical protein
MTGSPITNQELIDMSDDAQTLEDVANGGETTVVTSRLGRPIKSVANAVSSLGFDVPFAYTAGVSVTTRAQTTVNNNIVYGANPASLPFTTGASFDASQWYSIFRQQPRRCDLVEFGADPTGATNSDAALLAARNFAIANGATITGQGVFLVSSEFDFQSASIFMPDGHFKFANSFTAPTGYGFRFGPNARIANYNDDPLTTLIASSPRQIVFNVWANKDNQTQAQTAVLIDGASLPSGRVDINVGAAHTGVRTVGETEQFFGRVGAFDCTIALHDDGLSGGGSTTPDEIHWDLSCLLCTTLYKVEGNCSTSVNILSENSGSDDTTAWAVQLNGNKTTTLTGEIRGCHSRGIQIDGVQTGGGSGNSNNVTLDVKLLECDVADVLVVDRCRTISGKVEVQSSDGDIIRLNRVTLGGQLDLVVSSCEVASNQWLVRLGNDSTNTSLSGVTVNATFASANLASGATNAGCLLFDQTRGADVYVNSITGQAASINFNDVEGDTLSLPRQAVMASGVPLAVTGPTALTDIPKVFLRGQYSLSDLASSAGFTPYNGMIAEGIADYQGDPARLVSGGWIPTGWFIREATSAQLLSATNDVNTLGKREGVVYRVSDGNNRIVYARGNGATDTWRDGNGNTVYTPT